MITARAIKPRPAFIASINGRDDPLFQNIAAETGGEPPKKKRGRPTKVDLQQRAAEAAARGEIYTPPKTSAHKGEKPHHILTDVPGHDAGSRGAPIAAMISPTAQSIDSASSTPKKRGRPAKAEGDAKKLAIEATATAAGQIGGTIEPGTEVIKETQQPGYTEPGGLLTGVQERAGHVVHDQDTQMKEPEVREGSGTLHAFSGRTE